MPKQNESEKLVRKALKETKKNQMVLDYLGWCVVVGILIMAVVAFTHPAFDAPIKPQPTDEISEGCISCAKQMPTDCTTFFDNLPKECENCIGIMEEEECDKEYFVGMMNFAGIGILWLMIYMFLIIVLWTLTSSKKDAYIKQLKLEHALELDSLKKGRK